jgi:hypothetical protein
MALRYRARRFSSGHEPDGLAAVPLKVHLAFEQPSPLEGDECLAHPGGTVVEGVADLALQAVSRIGSQFATLLGDVLKDSAAQRSARTASTELRAAPGLSRIRRGCPGTPSELTREGREPVLPQPIAGSVNREVSG